jgi:hypothetical protein
MVQAPFFLVAGIAVLVLCSRLTGSAVPSEQALAAFVITLRHPDATHCGCGNSRRRALDRAARQWECARLSAPARRPGRASCCPDQVFGLLFMRGEAVNGKSVSECSKFMG